MWQVRNRGLSALKPVSPLLDASLVFDLKIPNSQLHFINKGFPALKLKPGFSLLFLSPTLRCFSIYNTHKLENVCIGRIQDSLHSELHNVNFFTQIISVQLNCEKFLTFKVLNGHKKQILGQTYQKLHLD